jgi:hypothetical protein
VAGIKGIDADGSELSKDGGVMEMLMRTHAFRLA